jgi:hypothetical protein
MTFLANKDRQCLRSVTNLKYFLMAQIDSGFGSCHDQNRDLHDVMKAASFICNLNIHLSGLFVFAYRQYAFSRRPRVLPTR